MLVKQFFVAPLARSPGEMLRFPSLGFVFRAVGHCEIGCEGRTRSCDNIGQNRIEIVQKANKFVKKKRHLTYRRNVWGSVGIAWSNIVVHTQVLGKKNQVKKSIMLSAMSYSLSLRSQLNYSDSPLLSHITGMLGFRWRFAFICSCVERVDPETIGNPPIHRPSHGL
jgi:hypothetical protein